jgi:ParB/RepB/Spo0J family partition protein
VVSIDLRELDLPQIAMRSSLDPDQLQDLASSMHRIGLINPITVRSVGSRWEVVAGARRLAAAKLLGWQAIPALAVSADIPGAEACKAAENWCRTSVDPVAEALYIRALKSRHKWSSVQVAKVLDKPESWVSERLAILDYPDELRNALADGRISFSAARELNRIEEPTMRDVYVASAVTSGCTPAQAARWREDANRPPWQEPEQPADTGVEPGQPADNACELPCDACGERVALAFRKVVFCCPGCHTALKTALAQLNNSDQVAKEPS